LTHRWHAFLRVLCRIRIMSGNKLMRILGLVAGHADPQAMQRLRQMPGHCDMVEGVEMHEYAARFQHASQHERFG
jgi:hypothetical protein